MHDLENIGPRIIIKFSDSFFITESVFVALICAIILIILFVWLGSGLKKIPGKKQVIAEFIVKFVYNLTRDNMGKQNEVYAPYIGTLIIWCAFMNMGGLFGLRPATADINTTFALAIATFLIIQGGSIKAHGVGGYLKHFLDPYPFMLPIKIIEEVSFPISLSFRLFGNIFGGCIVMALFFQLMEFVSEQLMKLPIPLFQAVIPLPLNLFFDVFEPILQAFIFTTLTMAFVSKAVTVHDK